MKVEVIRSRWWKFWQIDLVIVNLPTSYRDAYYEVEKSGIIYSEVGMPCGKSSSTWWELKDWVKEDIRSQLSGFLISKKLWESYGEKILASKKLQVKFGAWDNFAHAVFDDEDADTLDFYIRGGEIYFDSDLVIKREKVLERIGI